MQGRREAPTPSAQQFWRSAYDFDPATRKESELARILASNKLKRVPLGRLYGTQLELEPELGALEDSYARIYHMPLKRLVFPSAVSFHECHPSEDEKIKLIRVKADKDTLLRRFFCLGWVIMVDGNEWTRTGHVLVLDMDETANKKRHPWFLLASQWYDDHCLYPDGDRTIHAEQFVEQGESDVDGIFPNTDDRTTVARLRSAELEKQKKTGPFLQYFHPDLKFEITRFGQPDQGRNDPRYLKGSYLPVIMELYWDDQMMEEVCFNEDKMVYFSYNRLTGIYSYDQPAATDNYIERLPRPIPAPAASSNIGQHFSHARRRRDRDASRRQTSEA
ncbi:MAG: hypothetical protein HETSPECPRED_002861 [Heterodermia speciosa]|uniref:Uncharacterized protein n=1 Tax=Heterodermia speciosa TaxID=116794 RepID=A0A8H3J5I1_9LECA|nr:MAG: hypothetical protein HETSPECPRED_002861 [Heterodermia speciosa]